MPKSVETYLGGQPVDRSNIRDVSIPSTYRVPKAITFEGCINFFPLLFCLVSSYQLSLSPSIPRLFPPLGEERLPNHATPVPLYPAFIHILFSNWLPKV